MLRMTVTGTHIYLVLSRCVTELKKFDIYLQCAVFSVCKITSVLQNVYW